ncbi:mannonate dehydratase [Pelagicoccus sp. SDUM812003]|uniref:mannonate dehydratase n=1 Tax=Pelagicoccus sp. SDUM812003 TaxID=3041267 RepID=UPI00280FD740|nr:mannonate dehydratase [Pelagicoccus sp. SDUM812003]MDQ8201942.1 mannonate dehydratase [Pelagicoccus sp. SDUM812003]
MKLGLGLYKHMLTSDNFRFARQAGATHIVAHFVDYFRGSAHSDTDDQPTGDDWGWGLAGDAERLWTLEDMVSLRKEVEAHGLTLEAIENFDPAHWHDILLDGPKRPLHIENVKTILRRMGEAGIPVMGYNFSIAGVAGRTTGPYARGEAPSVGMEGPYDKPMHNGMVWNMIYDPDAPEGTVPSATHDQLWDRLQRFLDEVLPVAEEAGVTLAAHPDDPPMPTVRQQPRLVYQPSLYQKLIDLNPSQANKLEFCIGSLAEMTEGDIYETIDTYSAQNRLGYVHFRNVRGKVPTYKETFIDDGDIDMIKALEILKRNQFDGVLIPDHCPSMSCSAPWHAGMAYAMGYMKAALKILGC